MLTVAMKIIRIPLHVVSTLGCHSYSQILGESSACQFLCHFWCQGSDGYSPADLVPTASCLWDFKSFIHNGPPYHPRTEMLPHSIKRSRSEKLPKLSPADYARAPARNNRRKDPSEVTNQDRHKLPGKWCPKPTAAAASQETQKREVYPDEYHETGQAYGVHMKEKSAVTNRSVFASSDELIPQKKVPTLVLWDMRSCPLPEGRKCRYIVDNIPSAVLRNSSCSRIIMLAFTDDNIPDSIARLLTGMSLIFTLPCDDALTFALNSLHSRNYNILAAHPHCGVHSDLVATASCVWDFPSLIRGGTPYNVRKNMVPRCSFDFSKLSLKDAGRCQTRPDQDRESWLLKWCPKPATAEQIRIV